VYDIGDEFDSVLSILESWDKIEQQLMEMGQQLAQNPNSSGASVHEVSLAPPILYPGALYCAGANYADHVLEMSGKPPPAENTKPYSSSQRVEPLLVQTTQYIYLNTQTKWTGKQRLGL
jgi:2-keto-4-pentenoate hydratase/2-oxohepta-3-ene-1,7-dioic acid hydratase in catechol pathway